MSGGVKLLGWPSEWGLPSIDPRSLEFQLFLKFSEVPFVFEPTPNPEFLPKGLPVLQHKDKQIEFPDIALYIEENFKKDIDSHLTKEQEHEMVTLRVLVETQLENCRLYNWFSDDVNYNQLVKPTLSKTQPFPISIWFAGAQKTRSAERLSFEHHKNTEFYDVADDCYRILSNRLGSDAYFFGSTPTSLDATIAAHLAIHLYSPLPKPTLREILNTNHLNLVQYCDRVLSVLGGPPSFSDVRSDIVEKEKEKKEIRSRLGYTVAVAAVSLFLFSQLYRTVGVRT